MNYVDRCALDTRFNSFYRDEMHPFVDAMMVGLLKSPVGCQRKHFTDLLSSSFSQNLALELEDLLLSPTTSIAIRQGSTGRT